MCLCSLERKESEAWGRGQARASAETWLLFHPERAMPKSPKSDGFGLVKCHLHWDSQNLFTWILI